MGIKLDYITLRYGKKDIVKEVSLEFESGRLHMVMGSNGSGKSTLMKGLLGYLKPHNGTIFVDQKDLNKVSNKQRSELLSYVPQSTNYEGTETVLECVALSRLNSMNRFPSEDDINRSISTLSKVGLHEKRDVRMSSLSGGERQRALIARSLVKDTQYIFMDEPVSSLDIKYQIETMQYVRNLVRNEKRTVICIVHDINLAYAFGDTITIMKDGKVLASGETDSVLNPRIVEQAFGIHSHINTETKSFIYDYDYTK